MIGHRAWLALAFGMSFCSSTNQLLISKKLSYLTGEALFIYPLALSVFLLSMGFGSYISEKTTHTHKNVAKILAIIQFSLGIIAFISILSIDLLRNTQVSESAPIIFGLGLISIIGALSGMELPLIMSLYNQSQQDMKDSRYIIFIDYMSSLISSLIFVFILSTTLGMLQSACIIAILSLSMSCFIMNRLYGKTWKLKTSLSVLLFFIISSFLLVPKWEISIKEERIRKTLGYDFKLIDQFSTYYQDIDLFVRRMKLDDESPFDIQEVLQNPQNFEVAGFIDDSIQFRSQLGTDTDDYHYALIEPIRKFMDPQSLLILGGGDGLPAKQALRSESIKRIDMVDLDGEWIDFTKHNPIMRLHSHRSLTNSRINLHISDAFQWVITSNKKYDLIVIDFPASFNLASIRQSTIQFANDLKRILTENGVAIFQLDAEFSFKATRHYHATAKSTGLELLILKENDHRLGGPFTQFYVFKNSHQVEDFKKFISHEFNNKELSDHYRPLNFSISAYVASGGRAISFYDPKILIDNLKDFFSGL